MSAPFTTRGGDIVVTSGGVEKFSTAKKQFNRVPLAGVALTGTTITFPNFIGATYTYRYWTNLGSPPFATERCLTTGKFPAQEWGPAGLGFAAPYLLDDIPIGAMPDGINFVDVQVNLTRTTTPHSTDAFGNVNSKAFWGIYDWPLEFAEGEWLPLTDASMVVEKQAGFARMFWFEVIDGVLYLRRKQSIGASGLTDTHGLDFKSTSPPTGNLSSAHVNGSGCSGTNPSDFASVFTGDIKIVPCSS